MNKDNCIYTEWDTKLYKKFIDALKTEFGHDYIARFSEFVEVVGIYPGVEPDVVYLLSTLANRDEITSILEMGTGYSTTVLGTCGKPYFAMEQHCHYLENNRELYENYGVDFSKIECTYAIENSEPDGATSDCDSTSYNWRTTSEPVLPFTPDFVFCDGNSVMLSPYLEIYSSRVAGMDYYKEYMGNALIMFDDADLIPESIEAWLESIGRKVDYLFNPTGREARIIAISIPERYLHILDIIKGIGA